MSNMDEDVKSVKVKIESRPHRLGVGAVVPCQTKVVHSNDPVERRLRAKLEANQTRVAKNDEEPVGAGKGGGSHEDSDVDELESKARQFKKKRPVGWTSNLLAKKRHR